MLARRTLASLVPAAFVAAGLLAGCSHGGSLARVPVPTGGRVAGRVIAQQSDGSHAAPDANQAVGAYTKAIFPGPVQQDPPEPVATATTGTDGVFELRGLAAGRYFVTGVASPGITGRWVTVTRDRGASITLIRCTNCAIPL